MSTVDHDMYPCTLYCVCTAVCVCVCICLRLWLGSQHWHSKVTLREPAAHMFVWGQLTHAILCIPRMAGQMEL